jgi:hypothetical protein
VNFNEAPGTTPRHDATPRHCEAVEKCRGRKIWENPEKNAELPVKMQI